MIHLFAFLLAQVFFPPVLPGILNTTFPVPNSSSTIVIFGDSLGAGRYGPTSCVSAANSPASVAPASLTGTCWPDKIGAFYGAHVINLAVGGSPLTNVGPGGAGQGILRYNASYTCPSQSTSPTSGLQNNCNAGTVPALDSLVGPNTFLIDCYFGHNDNFYNSPGAFYSAFLSAQQTVINDSIVHGQPSNQVMFMGSFGGGNGGQNNTGRFADSVTSKANAYEASLIGARFVNVQTPLTTSVINDNSQSIFYDSIHPNDATNCVGAGCLGGSAVIASAVESPSDFSAAFYAAAYALAGELAINQTTPTFDASGNLVLPSGSSLQSGNTIIGAASSVIDVVLNLIGSGTHWLQFNGHNTLGFDTANLLIRQPTNSGGTYFQTSGGTNVMHFTTSDMILDNGGAFTGSGFAYGTSIVDPGTAVITGAISANGGLYGDGGTVLTYPWHPSSAPSCTISAGGSGCNVVVTIPHSGMVCNANAQGSGSLLGGIGYDIQVPASSGTSQIIYYVATAAIAGGGTVNFSVTCN